MTIHPTEPMGQKAPKERFTVDERAYFNWLHTSVGECCLTGRPDIHIAHTGGLPEGKGMSRKARVSTCLPIAYPLHLIEERGRAAFWRRVGVPDYLAWAERLHDIFEKGGDYREVRAWLGDMQARANRDEIRKMLMEGK